MEKGGAMNQHRMLTEALADYLEMMEHGAYFEAHERVESVWYPLRREKSDLAHILKALINAAIAFEHLKRERPQAAERARRVIRAYEQMPSPKWIVGQSRSPPPVGAGCRQSLLCVQNRLPSRAW
jgi:hypothetical protein